MIRRFGPANQSGASRSRRSRRYGTKSAVAGKIAGTLVTADELPYWLKKGSAALLQPSDPFPRLGLNGIKRLLGL